MKFSKSISLVSLGLLACSLALPQGQAKGNGKNIIFALGRSLTVFEGMFGMTAKDPVYSEEAYRIGKPKGFEKVLVYMGESASNKSVSEIRALSPQSMSFELANKKASWKSYLKALGINSTGVTAKKKDVKAEELLNINGVPKGWHVQFVFNLDYKGRTSLSFWRDAN